MPELNTQQSLKLAVEHHQAGRLGEAEAIYRQILAQQPNNADALHLLGLVAYQKGQNQIAVELIGQAIAFCPRMAEYHNNMGVAKMELTQFDDAIEHYRLAVAIKPVYPEVHNNLGNALREKGLLDEAITEFQAAISFKSDYPEPYNNLGNVFKDQKRLTEAIEAYRTAIKLRPKYAEAYYNLGNVLAALGDREEAIAAYQNALQHKPDFANAHYSLGVALDGQGQPEAAIDAYRAALRYKPDMVKAWCNLGRTLKDIGMFDEAIAAYHKAIQIKPDFSIAWDNLLFAINFHPNYSNHMIYHELEQWNRSLIKPFKEFILPHGNLRDPERQLRIGYVSSDFRQHVVGVNFLPLLREQDRACFKIFCYSNTAISDDITECIRVLADGWRDIVDVNDEQVARIIREDQIDILVDLSLHLAGNRLAVFAFKSSPVQVTFMGYPGSTGLSAMDYRLTDPYLDPPGMFDAFYSEESIRLPHTFWCHDPLTNEPAVNQLPALKNGCITFGCLNNFRKVNDDVLDLWAAVLAAIPNSHLLLLAPRGESRRRIVNKFELKNIHKSRLKFVDRLPRQEYLKLYHQIDLGLDTLPYNGHTTSLDGFWMGVPTITLIGRTVVGRAGWSQLNNLHLQELSAQTQEEYVEIAVKLANDLPRLKELRSTLRHRMENSPLMDAKRFARNIEAAYREMWRKWCSTSR